MQNFFSKSSESGQTADGAPWWMRYLGRAAGIVSGVGMEY